MPSSVLTGGENFRGDAFFHGSTDRNQPAHNRYWYWFRRKRDQSISLDRRSATMAA